MPPFSPDDDHQAPDYRNSNNGKEIVTFDVKAFPRRETVDKEMARRVISDLIDGLSGKETNHPHPEPRHHHLPQHDQQPQDQNPHKEQEDTESRSEILLEGSLVLDALEGGYFCNEEMFRAEAGTPSAEEYNGYFGSVDAVPGKNNNTGTTGQPLLYTIPERKVSFAGRVFGESILDDLQVVFIPHVTEFTWNDKKRMWYTRTELKAMRNRCFHIAKAVSRGNTELYCPCTFRGLEHLIEDCHQQFHNQNSNHYEYKNNNSNHIGHCHYTEDADSTTGTNTNGYSDCFDYDSSSTVESRRWGALEAVLCEQQHQRMTCLKTHGMIYSGMADPETIRSVYTAKGKTDTSQSIARAYALLDEECVNEWLSEESSFSFSSSPSSSLSKSSFSSSSSLSSATAGVQRELAYYYKDDDIDIDHYQSSSTSNELSNGMRWVFQKLLTPFLDIRDGNIYLQMGEECFLAYS